ncbi:unknown [Mycoplasma sp. CAG:472]|nr:unknown [Mycoplasma sp. CAG:472]
MDKLYLDFDENGLLTMYIEGNLDKFKSTLKFNNNKYIFGVEKRLIKDKNLIDKLKYEHISLIPKVDTINTKKNKKTEPTNEEKYEVHDLPDDIIFDGKDFYSLVPLEWTCNNGKYFTCLNTSYTRSTVISLLKKRFFDISLMNEYLNDTILPKIFDVKDVDRINSYEAIYKIFNETLDEIELPNYKRQIDISYKSGKIVLEKPKTLIKIDIPENVKVINCPSKKLPAKENILYDIYFPSTVENLQSIMTVYNGQINSIIFDKNFNGKMKLRSLITNKPINFLQIPCNIELMKSIINIGYSEFVYVFDKNSKLTLIYKNEKELLDFLHYFILLDKKLDSKKSRKFIFDESFDKYVPGIEFKFDNEIWEYPLYEFKKKVSLSDIDITLYGSELSHGVQNKIKRMLKNDNVHFVIEKLDVTKGQEHTEEKQKVNKTTLIADDIIDEILSIDYFGLDKNDVKNKINEILIKYNKDLSNLKEGLSLQSEEGLYTELLVKLNLLKESLYQKFEKNLVVYDMLDEVNNLLSILNNEEIVINTSLENDFYSLSKNILPFVEEKITDDLRNYLENEKHKLENYLLTGENRPYEDMDKFILSIRTYLNITLLSIRNYLNKEEILDVIRDYTNMQMKINYKEPIKNYLSIVLLEIDKIKNEIFDINPTNLGVHNIIDKINIDYSNMESNEIIKYVDSILMEIYGLYYKIKFNNISKLKKESYKMRLIK